MTRLEEHYMWLKAQGELNDVARSVLPTCLKTEIVATGNFRNWLKVLVQRTDDNPKAHSQIRQVMNQARLILVRECPEVFGWTHASPVEQMLRIMEYLEYEDGDNSSRSDEATVG